MKKKWSRMMCVILCAVMICGMMPMTANAAIGEILFGFSFTTFAELKELCANDYGQWTILSYTGTEPLVIQESLTLPANVELDVHGRSEQYGKLIIPEGVTLSDTINTELLAGTSIWCDELVVEGTLVANKMINITSGRLSISGELDLYNMLSLDITADCAIIGADHIIFGYSGDMYEHSGHIRVEGISVDLSGVKKAIALAEQYGTYRWSYDITLLPNEELVIDEPLCIPQGVGVQIGDGTNDYPDVVIAENCVLTGGFTLRDDLIIKGTLISDSRNIHIYYPAKLLFSKGAVFDSVLNIYIHNSDENGISDCVPNLNLSEFYVNYHDEYGMTYWTLSPKNSWIPITLYSFTDVKSGAYYYDAVLWAAENEITAGYGSDTTFCPDLACTRAQVVTFLWRAAGEPAPESSANPFTDIQKGWYYDAVLWAAEKGITAGYGSDTTFCPNQECTRAEIVTFLHRYAGLPAPASTSNPFVDVGANKWYTTAVLWAVGEGITNGLGSAVTFCPDTVCNRAQVVTFLYRSVEN